MVLYLNHPILVLFMYCNFIYHVITESAKILQKTVIYQFDIYGYTNSLYPAELIAPLLPQTKNSM